MRKSHASWHKGGLGHVGGAAKSLKLQARITIGALERFAFQEAPWPSAQFSSLA
jgi:hypothetical protein